MVLAGDDEIDLRHLPRDVVGTPDDAAPIETCARPLGTALKEFERDYLQRALAQAVRQAHAGCRDAGYLPQEPVGEAAPARRHR